MVEDTGRSACSVKPPDVSPTSVKSFQPETSAELASHFSFSEAEVSRLVSQKETLSDAAANLLLLPLTREAREEFLHVLEGSVDSGSPIHAQITELRRIDSEIERNRAELRAMLVGTNPGDHIASQLERHPEAFVKAFGSMISRLRQETGLMTELECFGIADAVQAAELFGAHYLIPVHRHSTESKFLAEKTHRSRWVGQGGAYAHGKIKINAPDCADEPTEVAAQLWEDLINDGSLHGSIRTLRHEFQHAIHNEMGWVSDQIAYALHLFTPERFLERFLFSAPRIQGEVDCRILDYYSPHSLFWEGRPDSVKAIWQTLVEDDMERGAYRMKPIEFVKQILFDTQALYLLGYTAQDLAELVKESRGLTKPEVESLYSARVEAQKRNQLGPDPAQWPVEMALRHIRKFAEIRLAHSQAQQIAAQELLSL